VFFVAITLASGPARAQDASQALREAPLATQAKRFLAAQAHYDDGAFGPALEEFKALAAETGSPNADLYVARCLQKLGRLPEAYEALRVTLRNATAKAATDPKYLKTRNTAAADLAMLESKIAKLIIAVAMPPRGLTVTLDGAAVESGAPLVQVEHEAVVRLAAPGKRDVERRVVLKAGETTTLSVVLEADAPGHVEPAAQASEGLVKTTGGGARIVGYVVLGLGAAGMATFAAAGVAANKRYDAVSQACGGKHCTNPVYTSQIDGGHTLDIVADVGLGVGLAGLASGALLVALGGPKAAAQPVVTGWAGRNRGGLGARLSF
jgi:hypothetical protein